VEALRAFLRLEAAGGIVLVAAAVLGFVCANSALAPWYHHVLDTKLTITLGELGVDKPLHYWINDGLMAVFFLLVGLELKRELLEGQFAEKSQIALPAVCALGGMLVPMGIYAWFNRGDTAALQGVPIPAATDIAFALGVLALLGSRVPLALKMLLTAIAVLDDLGAIVIIALFYTAELSWLSLIVGLSALAVLVALNRAGVMRLGPYVVVGLVMWLAVLKSGVHATLAGVALGMTIPLSDARRADVRPLETAEHALHHWVAFAILPIFAFANAGVPLAGIGLDTLQSPVPLGVALGLLLGKPIGVALFALPLFALRAVRLPEGVNGAAFIGMAMLCGVGFTMSLFMAGLAFAQGHETELIGARLGILMGSVLAALMGYALLRLALPRR
jgi:NhaA family Na+:H+ antiporter